MILDIFLTYLEMNRTVEMISERQDRGEFAGTIRLHHVAINGISLRTIQKRLLRETLRKLAPADQKLPYRLDIAHDEDFCLLKLMLV